MKRGGQIDKRAWPTRFKTFCFAITLLGCGCSPAKTVDPRHDDAIAYLEKRIAAITKSRTEIPFRSWLPQLSKCRSILIQNKQIVSPICLSAFARPAKAKSQFGVGLTWMESGFSKVGAFVELDGKVIGTSEYFNFSKEEIEWFAPTMVRDKAIHLIFEGETQPDQELVSKGYLRVFVKEKKMKQGMKIGLMLENGKRSDAIEFELLNHDDEK